MRTKTAFSIYFASISFVITLLIGLSFIYLTDEDWFALLFKSKIFMVPIGLFLLMTPILFGLATGWVIGGAVQQKNKRLVTALTEIESGNYDIKIEASFQDDDFVLMSNKVKSIAERLKQQATLQQKLASERVEWNRELKEEVLTKERNRLARELHDSVSQQLFAATMLLSAINQNPDSEQAHKQLKIVEGVINEAQTEMRALLLHLRPVQLEGKSLKQGIEEVLTEITAKIPLKVIWNLQDVHLEKGVEDHLFRIVQEAVSNTLRHAKASLLEVSLKQVQTFVYLKMIDNGKGFDINDKNAGSYGITNIKERAAEVGGDVKIISLIGKGTSIEVKVPILYRKRNEMK